MDEKLRVILELHDKFSAELVAAEKRLEDFQKRAGVKTSKVASDATRKQTRELKIQAEAYRNLEKTAAPGIKRIEASLKPLTLRQMQLDSGLRRSTYAQENFNKTLERGSVVARKSNMDVVGSAIEKLGEYAGISTQRIAGMVVNLSTFASTMKDLNRAGVSGADAKGGALGIGGEGELGIIQRILLSIAAAFGLAAKSGNKATQSATTFGTKGSAGVRTFFKAIRAVTAIRVGLFFKRMITGSKQASNVQKTLAQATRGLAAAFGVSAKAATVATGRMSLGMARVGQSVQMAVDGLDHLKVPLKGFGSTIRSVGVLTKSIYKPFSELFNLMKGVRKDPLSVMASALKGLPQGYENVRMVLANTLQVMGNLVRLPKLVAVGLRGMKINVQALGKAVSGFWQISRGAFVGLRGLVQGVSKGATALFRTFREGFRRGVAIQQATKAFNDSEKAASNATKATTGFFDSISARFARVTTIGFGLGAVGDLGFKGALIDLDKFGKKQDSVFGRMASYLPFVRKKKTAFDSLTSTLHSVTKATTGYGNTTRDQYNRMAGGVRLVTKLVSLYGPLSRAVTKVSSAVVKSVKNWRSHSAQMVIAAGSIGTWMAAQQGMVDAPELGIAIGAFNLLNNTIGKGIEVVRRRRAASLAASEAEKTYYTRATEAASRYYASARESLRNVASGFGLVSRAEKESRWTQAVNLFARAASTARDTAVKAFRGIGRAYDSMASRMFRGGAVLTAGPAALGDMGFKQAVFDLDRLKGKMQGARSWMSGFAADVRKQKTAMDAAAEGSQKLGGSVLGMKIKIAAAATAVIGLAAGFFKLTQMALTQGREHYKAIETVTLQFQFLTGSAAKANETVERLTAYAARTPFQLKGIAQAQRLLLVFGGEALATQENLELIGDAAAVSGQQFERVAFWIGRAYTLLKGGGPIGEATRALTEMGVISGDVQNQLNKMATEGSGLEATFGLLLDTIRKNEGATLAMSQTLAGLETTLSDTRDLSLALVYESGWDDLEKSWIRLKIGLWELVGSYVEWRNELTGEEITDFIRDAQKASETFQEFMDQISKGEKPEVIDEASVSIRAINHAYQDLDDTLKFIERSQGDASASFEVAEAKTRVAELQATAYAVALSTAKKNLDDLEQVQEEFNRTMKAREPLGVQTGAEQATKEYERAEKRAADAASRRQKREDAARKAAEEAARAREEEMARAAEAHQRMFENMTMFSAETREFGGELSAVIAPLGVLNDEVMQAAQGLHLWSGPIAELDEFLSRGPSVKSVGLDKLIDPEVIEKGIDHLEELRKTLDLLAQTGDGMAQRLSAATSIILGAYETMVAGIRNAELKSVFLAIAQAVLSLVNVFRSLGATSQELIDTLDGVESAIDSVRSGSLSAAEAVDRMMNWQGNEEGHQFVLDMIDDFMYLGREADEAVKLVGEFWAAMRAGDQGEMERIGMQLVNVADQARMLREENEKLADTYSTVMSAYERIQDAAESAYQSVYEAAIKAGHTEAEAAEFAAMASEHKAKQQEAIELQKFARLAALEAALTAVRAGNADQAVEIAKQAALDSLAAWAAALEAMAELDSAIQSVIDATVGNIEDISFEFEALGTGASGAAGGVSEVADAAKEAEDALKELVGAVDGLGIAFDHLNREIAADVLGQKLAKYEDQFQTLVNAGQDVDRALAGMSDDSIRSIGELALEAHNLGMELTYVQHTALQMYAALRSDEIAERLQEIREARETRLDLDSIDARLRALRHQQSVYEEQHEERVRQINAERDARLSAIDRETEALKAQRFDTEDVWEAARSFGFTSRDQLGPNFLQEQGAAKIKEVSDEIRKLQLTGLSDEALAGNEVVQSRMARLVSDIEEYGLKGLPEHLAGLAKILGYENVEIGTGLSTLNDTIWNLEQERTRVEQNAVEAIERENRRREEAERSFTEQIESLEMERRAIEDARLERERERLLVEEERLMAERELLRQVTSMLRSRPKPPKPTPQPASKPKLHPSAVKPAPKPKKKPKPAPAPTTTTPAPAPAPTPAPAPAPVPVPRPPTPEPGPHPGGTGPPVGEGDAYQRGSGGIRDFGAGTRAVLHNREAVVTESSWLEAIERAGRGSGMRHQQRAVEQFFKATMASVEMERQAIEDAQRVRAIEKRHYQDDFASGRSAVIRRRQERQGPTTEDFRAALEDVNVVVNGDVNVDGTTFGTFVLKKGARTAHLRGLR